MPKITQFFRLLLFSLSLIGCSGSPTPPPATASPPPPLDAELLGVIPFETDVVLWVDFKALKTSRVWSLVSDLFEADQLAIPGQAAINPLFACDEAVLGFWESEQFGSQLLVVAKGDENTRQATMASVMQNDKSKKITAEGLEGVKAKDFFLLALTPRTVLFGNEKLVRMAAKAAKKAARSLKENPKYDDFQIQGPASARLRYHRDRNEPLTSSLKNMAPKINPDAVSRIDGEANTSSGLNILINVHTETQVDASMIVADLNQTRDQLAKNMMVVFLGIEWLLKRVEVKEDKSAVKINISLSDLDVTEIGRLMNRLQKLKEMLGDERVPRQSKAEDMKDRAVQDDAQEEELQ